MDCYHLKGWMNHKFIILRDKKYNPIGAHLLNLGTIIFYQFCGNA